LGDNGKFISAGVERIAGDIRKILPDH